jgi:hypothetical protein
MQGATLCVPVINFVSAGSRKSHGAAGDFDIVFTAGVPVTGNLTVEPRDGANGHTIVFVFDGPVTDPGVVTVVNHLSVPIGTPGPLTVTGTNRNEVSVTVTGIPDASRVQVSLGGVNGSVSVTTAFGVLFGDVGNTRERGVQDVQALRARAGQTVTSSTLLHDLNLTGVVTAADIAGLKARGSAALP